MPAIQLARLRSEVAQLISYADHHGRFIQQLNIFLERYANRAQRPGEIGSRPILPTFNVPAPVLRQVKRELTIYISQNPDNANELINQLWHQKNFECRLLAVFLLGVVDLSPSTGLYERIKTYFLDNEDVGIAAALIDDSLSKLISMDLQMGENQIYQWLLTKSVRIKILGLRSLGLLLKIPSFQDMPWLFSVTSPYIRQSSPELRPYTLRLLQQLARQYPQELIYVFQDNLQFPEHTDTKWFIRNCQREFSPDYHPQLRKILQQSG